MRYFHIAPRLIFYQFSLIVVIKQPVTLYIVIAIIVCLPFSGELLFSGSIIFFHELSYFLCCQHISSFLAILAIIQANVLPFASLLLHIVVLP